MVAVGSRSAEGAAAFLEKFPGIRGFGSYEELLADPEVDAVYLSTPHPQHAEWAIAAAEAGKHVVCEKPLTLNAAQAMVVVEAARRNGVFLMEGFMYRCHPRTEKVAELIRDGVIGKVRLIRAAFSFATKFDAGGRLFSNALGGGGILDVGCYTASIARLVAGAAVGRAFLDPDEVKGVATLCETGVDTVASATLKFPGGILAELSCGVEVRQPSDLVVFGDAGCLRVPSFWNPPGPIEVTDYGTGKTTVVETDGNPHKYALEADAVARALPALESPSMSWSDTLGNMRTLDAWRASVRLEFESERDDAPEQSLPVSRRPLQPGRFGTIARGTLPGLSKALSRLVLGLDNQKSMSQMGAMVDDFVERGGNAFDTAYIYGRGRMERLFGQWLRTRGMRNEVVLIAKGAHTPDCHPEGVRRQLEESLDRLQVDCADVYLMHRDNPDVPVGEFVDVLDELRCAGKMKIYGGSNWTMERVREANAYARRVGKQPFGVVSNNLSLAQMVDPVWAGCVSAKGREWAEFLKAEDLSLLAWSSQARGYFVPDRAEDPEMIRCWDSPENQERRRRAESLAESRGVTPINIALAYVLSQPFGAFALFGPRSIEETVSSLPGAEVVLSPSELAWLDLETESL